MTLPQNVPLSFFEDVVYFTQMFEAGTVACSVHGERHQIEMKETYPADWMEWVFNNIGMFEENQ